MFQLKSHKSFSFFFFFFLLDKILRIKNFNQITYIINVEWFAKALIGFGIELKIRGSTLPLFIHKTYYLIISFYCNCISTLNSLFLRKIIRLFDQYFLFFGGGCNSYFFFIKPLNIYKIYLNCIKKLKIKNFGGAKAPPTVHVALPLHTPITGCFFSNFEGTKFQYLWNGNWYEKMK